MRLRELAEQIGAILHGNADIEVRSVSSIAPATLADVVFVEDVRFLEQALECGAGAVIARESDLPANADKIGKPLLIHANPRLAFARAAEALRRAEAVPGFVHPTALIEENVEIASDARIEAYAVIGRNCRVGARSHIGPGCILGAGVTLGADCDLVARVTIYAGATLGNRVVVHAGAVLGSDGFGFARDPESGRYVKFPQIGRLRIEDDVEIGANVTIDRGALGETVIGRGVKLDNMVHIGHNAQLGENVVIAAQSGVSGSAVLERDVLVGGQVGIADHVRIEEGAILGAQSGIPTKKVIRGKGVVFWGTPARPIAEYLKELAVLSRLARKKKE